MKKIVLTFDDGLKSHLYYAAPLLEEYGYPASFYINGAFTELKQNKFLTWEEIVTLFKKGFEIGSHCFDHNDKTKLSPQQIANDIARLENHFRSYKISKPRTLVYPGYHVNTKVTNVVKSMGYKFARAGCEKTSPFNYFQDGGSGTFFNSLYHCHFNINCLGIFGATYYPADWKQDLNRLPVNPDVYGIFCFHDFDTDEPTSIPKAQFESFLNYINTPEYKVIALKDVI